MFAHSLLRKHFLENMTCFFSFVEHDKKPENMYIWLSNLYIYIYTNIIFYLKKIFKCTTTKIC